MLLFFVELHPMNVLIFFTTLFCSMASAQIINEFMPDPAGTDTAPMPDGEWIELYGNDSGAVDLSGWRLSDDTPSHRLTIAATNTLPSTILEPGGYVVVYRNGDSDFSLNNGEDEVRLYYPNGTNVTSTSYHRTSMGLSWAYLGGAIPWNLTLPTPGLPNVNVTAACDVAITLEPPTRFSDGDEIVARLSMVYGNGSTLLLQRRVSNGWNDTIERYDPKELSFTFSSTQRFHPRLHGGQFFRAEAWIENATCNDDPLNDYASVPFWVDPSSLSDVEHFSVPKRIIGHSLDPGKSFFVTWDLPIAHLIGGEHDLTLGNASLLHIDADPNPLLIHLTTIVNVPPCGLLTNDTLLFSAKGPRFSDDYVLDIDSSSCVSPLSKDITRAATLTFANAPHEVGTDSVITVNLSNTYMEPVAFSLDGYVRKDRKHYELTGGKTILLSPRDSMLVNFSLPRNVSGMTDLVVETKWQGRKTPKTITVPIYVKPELEASRVSVSSLTATHLPHVRYQTRQHKLLNWIPLLLLLVCLLVLPLFPAKAI